MSKITTQSDGAAIYYIAACDVEGQTLFLTVDDGWTFEREWVPDPFHAYGLSSEYKPSDIEHVKEHYEVPQGATNLRLMKVIKNVTIKVEEVKP